MLEPAYSGKKLIKEIAVKTTACTYHSHLFFAENRLGLDQLGRSLDGIEYWMDKTPGGVIPSFDIPATSSQTDRNLIRWVSTVYYLAWTSDAPYLEMEVEYEQDIDRIGFFPWGECPQPPQCRPLEWLTHRPAASADLRSIQQKFANRGERFPDVVDAYLTGELITSSLAAIDILAYVMHGQRKEAAINEEESAKALVKKKRGKSKNAEDGANLRRCLLVFHNPWENVDESANPEEPLVWHEIADKLGWRGAPSTVQSRVSRAMKEILGSMTDYKNQLLRGIHLDRPPGASLLYRALVEPDYRRPSSD